MATVTQRQPGVWLARVFVPPTADTRSRQVAKVGEARCFGNTCRGLVARIVHVGGNGAKPLHVTSGLGDKRPSDTVPTSFRGDDDGELMSRFIVALQADTAEMGPITSERLRDRRR